MKIMLKNEITEDWKSYQKGKDYNTSIQYKSKIDKNERFYAGDQWRGIQSANLPTPVFNIIKRIVDNKISNILNYPLTIRYSGIYVETDSEGNAVSSQTFEDLTENAKYHWEKDKMNFKLRRVLLDAANSGDMCAYTYWNSDEGYDTNLKGDFCTEMLDGINVFFGNVNDARVQTQPYILVTGRTMTEYLKNQAKQNKLSQKEIDLITPDSDYEEQAGDGSKTELDDKSKSTYVIKFWKKDGKVYYRKSVKNVTIIKEKDTGLTLYPIAWGNWIPRKNSYHGEAEVTSLISAQIFYNKQMAMSQKSSMDTAYPKVLYDKTRLAGFSNAVGGTFGVLGDVTNVARYLNGGQADPSAMQVLKEAANMTYQAAGVTDAMTGEMRPENTSAIIALQKAAATPLDMQRENLLQFVEDIAEIWLDFMRHKYSGGKKIFTEKDGQLNPISINSDTIKDMVFKTNIDVGAARQWSEIAQIETLGNAMTQGYLPVSIYMEELPKGIFSDKAIQAVKSFEEEKKQQAIQDTGQQIQ